MPDVQTISLASCSKFNPDEEEYFSAERLAFIDFSGCSKINEDGLGFFFDSIEPSNILHLNLSGCSSQIDDDILAPICDELSNLESLNLSGLKKLTEFGFGCIAWSCRETLKSLSVRGCTGIDFTKLLSVEGSKILNMSLTLSNSQGDPRQASPPNMVTGHNRHVKPHNILRI
jgi:hypothetical protein